MRPLVKGKQKKSSKDWPVKKGGNELSMNGRRFAGLDRSVDELPINGGRLGVLDWSADEIGRAHV